MTAHGYISPFLVLFIEGLEVSVWVSFRWTSFSLASSQRFGLRLLRRRRRRNRRVGRRADWCGRLVRWPEVFTGALKLTTVLSFHDVGAWSRSRLDDFSGIPRFCWNVVHCDTGSTWQLWHVLGASVVEGPLFLADLLQSLLHVSRRYDPWLEVDGRNGQQGPGQPSHESLHWRLQTWVTGRVPPFEQCRAKVYRSKWMLL